MTNEMTEAQHRENFKFVSDRGWIGQFDDWMALHRDNRVQLLAEYGLAKDGDSDYKTVELSTPPTLRQKDNGKWVIQLHDGNITYETPLGFWFLRQVFEKIVIPAVVK